MQRFFVTVQAPEDAWDGMVLVNKLMVDCETEKQAIRAGKSAAVDAVAFSTPSLIPPFVARLQVSVSTTR